MTLDEALEAAQQAEIEAGMRQSLEKAGVKPKGRRAAGVH